MNTGASAWLTDERARLYLDGVRGAIPGAALQLSVLGRIAQSWCHSPATILDLGCGDGILGLALRQLFPSATSVFVDFSEPMLAAVRARTIDLAGSRVVLADLSAPSWTDAVRAFSPFDIVVSGFAIHHQPNARKHALFAEIHELLAPRGVFLNLDQVASSSSAVERVFDDFFIDHLREFHHRVGSEATLDATVNAYFSAKGENLLTPLDDQCQWLRDTGYADVDCFCKVFDLALFGGRKAE